MPPGREGEPVKRRRGWLLGLVTLGACATSVGVSGPGATEVPVATVGPFASQRLQISDRTPAGFTVEAQLVLDNPGPGTMRIRAADYVVTLGGETVAKGDVNLDQTAEASERQGVVIAAKAVLGERGAALSAKKVAVRMSGLLHVSQSGDRDLPFDVRLEVPGASLVGGP